MVFAVPCYYVYSTQAVLGGVLGGGFGTSGPPVVVYTSMQPWTKDEVASTLQGFFFAVTVVQLVSLFFAHLLDLQILLLDLKLAPLVLVGVWGGGFL